MVKTVVVTGVCGFIFSNFIRQVASNSNYRFVGVDKLVKEFNIDNMYKHSNYKFYLADISDAHAMDRIFQIEKPDIVIGGAAESFVDNSITDIMPFLQSNVIGTQVLINACLKYNVEKYVHISTDEIYGQVLKMLGNHWKEDAPLQPRNPYAASKGAAELIVRTAHETHGLQYQMTRSCNVYGPRQKRDNLIPHIITSLLNDTNIRIHGDGENFRQYIYIDDEISAIMKIIEEGKINEVYNIGAWNYNTNLQMVNGIARLMNKPPKIEFIADRKAHDFGYSVDTDKLEGLGWFPETKFTDGLLNTIEYYEKL